MNNSRLGIIALAHNLNSAKATIFALERKQAQLGVLSWRDMFFLNISRLDKRESELEILSRGTESPLYKECLWGIIEGIIDDALPFCEECVLYERGMFTFKSYKDLETTLWGFIAIEVSILPSGAQFVEVRKDGVILFEFRNGTLIHTGA